MSASAPGSATAPFLIASRPDSAYAEQVLRRLFFHQRRKPCELSQGPADWPALDHKPLTGAKACVHNYIIDRIHPVTAGVPAGDAQAIETMSELWFDDEAAMKAAIDSVADKALIFEDPLLEPMAVYEIEEITIR